MVAYRVFSIDIESAFPVRSFACTSGDGDTTVVTIRRESIREPPSHVSVVDGVLRMRTPAAWFRMVDGTHIGVHPLNGVSAVEPFLVGPAIAGVLYQRGLFLLHGAVVQIHDQTVLFLGDTGAGKSTLAASFLEAGYDVLSDDIAALETSSGKLVVRPSYPALKLDPDGPIPPPGHDASWTTPDINKRFYRLDSGFHQHPEQVDIAYVLTEGETLTSDPVSTRDSFREFLAHSYRYYLVTELGATKRHFEQCARVSRQLELRRLARPFRESAIPELVDFVPNDLADA